MNNAILAEEKQMPLFAEMAKFEGVEYIAGGATQNSIRVCAMMLQQAGVKGSASFIGCVGDDREGQRMKYGCNKDGVSTFYQ